MIWSQGNPVPIHVNQSAGTLNHFSAIEFREAQLPMTRVHSLVILVYSEHVDLILAFFFVCFCSLKTLYTVMQSRVGWIQVKVLEWLYFWTLPASVVPVVIAHKHVVCKHPSEDVLVIVTRFRLFFCGFLNNQILCLNLFKICKKK